jgi:hypothetical protein
LALPAGGKPAVMQRKDETIISKREYEASVERAIACRKFCVDAFRNQSHDGPRVVGVTLIQVILEMKIVTSIYATKLNVQLMGNKEVKPK